MSFSADSLFDFDKSIVKPDGRQALERFARELQGLRYDTVSVTGHTDRLGGHAYNLALSQRRATAVRDVLVANGVDAGRISATGVDGDRPMTTAAQCPGSKPTAQLIACLQPDRRVEVQVTATR